METAVSCTECSQVSGIIKKVGRRSLKAPSLPAVLRAAVFPFEDRSDRNHHVLSMCKRVRACTEALEVPEVLTMPHSDQALSIK